MGLKDTLHMGSTGFEMRGNLPHKEPSLLKEWEEGRLYERLLSDREGAEEYLLHDGPPYANGDIHCGHMMNRLLKDFVVRSKAMEGYRTPFVPGWDTHGLPIEVQVARSGVDRKKVSVPEFRRKCREYALQQVERQKEQVRRLGILADFGHPYLTLQKDYEADQVLLFGELALKGLVRRGVKPVYWSPASESALAEAEVEYKDVPARTIYVSFDLEQDERVPEGAKVLVWTTTPWTIPADLAITLNPRFEYGFYETERGTFLFLQDLLPTLRETLGLGECRLLRSFKGKELEGLKAVHPLYPGRRSPLIVNNYVTKEAGTGCVHTAPDHGTDDYNACLPYGIHPFCPVDGEGVLRLGKGDPLDGLFYEEANGRVIELLEESGHLLKEVDIVHSYPHDWRTHTPVIFRATPQWFCSIEPIREELLKSLDEVVWTPEWGKEKMRGMIEERADWCISRQRAWGVPLPILYGKDGEPLLLKPVFEKIARIFREEGSDVWFEKEASYFLPEGMDPEGVTKEKDIMDVWFDSGSSWRAVLKGRGMKCPADLYLEGNDQYRGWFNSSLTLSVALTGHPSFKRCLTHGWVMDESWQKMSKSKGNGIDPSKVADEMGADLLRLWAAGVSFVADVRIGETAMKAVGDQYRKIRNAMRFLFSSLDGYEEGEPSLMGPADRWARASFLRLMKKGREEYRSFSFPLLLQDVLSFLTDLSGFYLDVAKDSLYCDSLSSPRRGAIRKTLMEIAHGLTLLLAPILPFTMEECYRALPLPEGKRKGFLALERFPEEEEPDGKDLREYSLFLSLREKATKAIEEARAEKVVGASQDAEILLPLEGEELALARSLGEEELSRLLLVSKAALKEGAGKPEVTASKEEKCPRCRRRVPLAGEWEGEKVCERCLHALEEER